MTNTVVTSNGLAQPIDRHPSRLRAMIELWEQDGWVRPEIAAGALRPEARAADHCTQSLGRLRWLKILGYLGAAPVAAAGLLLAQTRPDIGSLLLIGLLVAVASPRGIRVGAELLGRPQVTPASPRHRATHLTRSR